MSDSTPGGFADTPGPEPTPEQDAEVRSLLAFLRDEPVEMPLEVELRLYAVLAEERRTAATGAGAPAVPVEASDGERRSGAPALAPVTVLPARRDRRGPSTRVLQVVGGLAAAAVVVIGVVTVLGNHPAGSFSASSAAGGSSAANAAPSPGDAGATGTRLTASGTGYTKAALQTQVAGLVAAARTSVQGAAAAGTPGAAPTPAGTLAQPQVAGTTARVASLTPAPAPAPASTFVLRNALASLQAPGAAAACVARLTGGDGSTALAIDVGTYAGKPALVVVIPTAGHPASLDVFVVTPDCSPTFLEFERLPAS